MLQVFIDTNVYVEFFRFGKDTLDELRKLAGAIHAGNVKLLTTDQVRDELRRGRERRVAESLDALDARAPKGGLPHIARNLSESHALIKAQDDYTRNVGVPVRPVPQEHALEQRPLSMPATICPSTGDSVSGRSASALSRRHLTSSSAARCAGAG